MKATEIQSLIGTLRQVEFDATEASNHGSQTTGFALGVSHAVGLAIEKLREQLFNEQDKEMEKP